MKHTPGMKPRKRKTINKGKTCKNLGCNYKARTKGFCSYCYDLNRIGKTRKFTIRKQVKRR